MRSRPLIAALVAGLAVVVVVAWPRFRPGQDRERTAGAHPPAAAGAFATGGRPDPGPAALEHALSEGLTQYIIAVDGWARTRRGHGLHAALLDDVERAQAALLTAEVTAALGDAASARFRDVLQAVRVAALAPPAELDRAADALTAAVLAFDAALTARGLGYVLDNDVMADASSRVVLLFAFRVEEVTRYRAGDARVSALHLTRLDKLNWSYNLLGFTTAERHEAMVLLEQVDDRVVDRLLPQLAAAPPPFYRIDAADRAAPWHEPLQARAAALVRREYGDLGQGDDARRLGELVARRKRLIEAWNQRLEPRGLSLDLPDALSLGWNPDEVEGMVPGEEITELRELEDALREERLIAAFSDARTRLAESIARHEVQHRLDHLRGEAMPMPSALGDFVGGLRGADGQDRPGAARARAELSAYLAELARDPRSPGVGLAIIAQFLVEPRHWGTAESYAAAVILEGLIDELRLPGPAHIVAGGEIDRARLTEILIAATDRPADELRGAAARLWQRLFQAPLPELAPEP